MTTRPAQRVEQGRSTESLLGGACTPSGAQAAPSLIDPHMHYTNTTGTHAPVARQLARGRATPVRSQECKPLPEPAEHEHLTW